MANTRRSDWMVTCWNVIQFLEKWQEKKNILKNIEKQKLDTFFIPTSMERVMR